MKRPVCYLFVLLFTLFSCNDTRVFYVATDGDDVNPGTRNAPFLSIQKAIDQAAVKGVSKIFIREGVYRLDKPLVISPVHSRDDVPLVIENYKNERAIINGSRDITGWEIQENGWWKCRIPEVASGDWNFNQLYVNGELRQKARKPNSGFLRVKGMPEGTPGTVHYHKDCRSFEFAEGDIDKNWKNIEDVNVIVYHFWTDSHLPIQSIDDETNIVTFKHTAGKVFTDDFSENGARYIVENVFEELDTAGEWYLDRSSGDCYYFPGEDEQPDDCRITAPVAPGLITMEGDPGRGEFVSNIHFRGLEFCYTNYILPPGNSNDQQGSASITSAVELKGARNCSFEHCSFYNLGNWAFRLSDGCTDNVFRNNLIEHIGAGGFIVNGGDYDAHPFFRTSRNMITGNHIHHYGDIYPSAVGILLQKTEGNVVSRNHIHHGYYTGISIGWEWGYQRSISRDNIIEHNHIHHIGQGLLSDMGAIYTLGVSPGTVIRNNLIHDVEANHYGGWGIYHDEGSTHILVENNIVYNTKFATFNIHFAKENTVRNNIFALGRLQQINRTRSDPHKSVFFEQNIIYWKTGELLDGNWDERTYDFYFHPKNEGGIRTVSRTFDMDYNLYYNPGADPETLDWNGKSREEWQASGYDRHSLYADPLFMDAENYDFRLKENSPAFELGFQPIDISKAREAGKAAGPGDK